jgi:anaerobic dimethyl sulfoxide reductase subunit C (anchor subunit)
MELQWPLIIFTTLVCVSSGSFGTLGVLNLLGKGDTVKIPLSVTALVTAVIGGIATIFHLQHLERAFNGFAQISSGITQEIVALGLIVAGTIIYILVSRDKEAPKWVGVLAIVLSLLMVLAMAHSYVLPSRPLWDSPLLYLFYLAQAVLFGGLTASVIVGIKGVDAEGSLFKVNIVGGILTLISVISYAIYIPSLSGSFNSGYYYADPTSMVKGVTDYSGIFSGFLTGETALLFWLGVFVVGAVVPIAIVLVGRKTAKTTPIGFAAAALIAAIAGGICFRTILYVLGFSIYAMY